MILIKLWLFKHGIITDSASYLEMSDPSSINKHFLSILIDLYGL